MNMVGCEDDKLMIDSDSSGQNIALGYPHYATPLPRRLRTKLPCDHKVRKINQLLPFIGKMQGATGLTKSIEPAGVGIGAKCSHWPAMQNALPLPMSPS